MQMSSSQSFIPLQILLFQIIHDIATCQDNMDSIYIASYKCCVQNCKTGQFEVLYNYILDHFLLLHCNPDRTVVLFTVGLLHLATVRFTRHDENIIYCDLQLQQNAAECNNNLITVLTVLVRLYEVL